MLARLEVIALGPLVPGVHEHEVFVAPEGLKTADDAGEPASVLLWRVLRRDPRTTRCPCAPGRVVPARSHATVKLVRRERAFERAARQVSIVVEFEGAKRTRHGVEAPQGAHREHA